MEKCTNGLTSAAVSAFSTSALCWLAWQQRTAAKRGVSSPSSSSSSSSSASATSLELTIDEKTRLYTFSPASAITFFDGSPPIDFLQARVHEILVCNPYLTLRLRRPSVFSWDVLAVYDTNPEKWCIADYFDVVRDSSISPSTPYPDLMQRVNKHQTKASSKCVNRNEVVFKVTLIEISSVSYAVMVSLNHMIGDGYTFYKLSSMLSRGVTPTSLDPVRNHSFQQEAEALLCPHFMAMLRHPLVLVGFLYNTFMYSPRKPYVCVVDTPFVEREKMKYAQGQKEQSLAPAQGDDQRPSFISTNDIITSWYVRFSKCAYAGMIVNFRNRLQGYTDAMCGNYARAVLHCAADVQQPQGIRESLLRLQLPPPLQRVGGSSRPDRAADKLALLTLNFAGVTSWASFYEEVSLPGSEVALHLPVMSLSSMGCRIVFKCNKRDTSVVLWSATTLSTSELLKEAIISRLL